MGNGFQKYTKAVPFDSAPQNRRGDGNLCCLFSQSSFKTSINCFKSTLMDGCKLSFPFTGVSDGGTASRLPLNISLLSFFSSFFLSF